MKDVVMVEVLLGGGGRHKTNKKQKCVKEHAGYADDNGAPLSLIGPYHVDSSAF